MDDGSEGVATAESPAAADVSAATPPAGAQNTGTTQPPAAKEPPFHQHPRFQQLIGENRNLKGELAEMRSIVDGLKRTAEAPARTADERAQRGEAIKALKDLMTEDPELAELLSIRKEFPQLKQGYQGVQQLSQAQQQAQQRQTFTHIEQLAKSADLPTDKAFLSRLFRLVVSEAQSIPEGEQRYMQGDMSLFDEAFEAVKTGFLGQVRREAAAPVLNAKLKTQRLPPVSRGGPAGAEAPPKLVEGKEREFERGMHQRAAALLGRLTGS